MDNNIVKVYYNQFWDGFLENIEGVNVLSIEKYFEKLNIKTKYTINPYEAEILVESYYGGNTLLNLKKWKMTIFFSGEVQYRLPSYIEKYSIVLGTNTSYKNCVPYPLFYAYILSHPFKQAEYKTSFPPKNICSVISNGNSQIRNHILEQFRLNNLHIDMGGKFNNNIGYKVGGAYWESTIIDFYRQYKFVLSFENGVDEYYITEKIINSLKAGVIPIYFGSPNITKYINKDRIIVITPDNVNESIHRVKQIMDDENEWLRIVNQPIFTENVDKILDEAVENTLQIIGQI